MNVDAKRLVTLSDCCSVINGTTPTSGDPSHWVGDVIWVTPTDLGKLDGMYVGESERRISRQALASHNLTLCPPGSVVLSSRAPIGHLGIAVAPLCTNQGCKTLIPREGVNSEYLYYSLLQAVPDLKALGSGATFTEISKSQVEAFQITLVPPPEQKRIAESLMRAMELVAAARRAAEERLAAAEALPAAYLRDLFEGPEVIKSAPLRLGDVCDLLPSKSISSLGDVEVRAITTGCLSERGFLPAGIKTARMHSTAIRECLVRPGEVLVARSNTPELVGRASMYLGEPKGIVASDLTIRVWPRSELSRNYVSAFLSYLFQTGYWRERAGGASATMKKITREQLLAQELRMPVDARVAQRLAQALSRRLECVKALIGRCRDELAAVNALPASLLRAAFNGEL